MKQVPNYTYTIVGPKASGKTDLFKTLVIENSNETEKLLNSISEHKRIVKSANDQSKNIEINFIDSVTESASNSSLKKSIGLIITYDITNTNPSTKDQIEKYITDFELVKSSKNSVIILVGTNLDKVTSKDSSTLKEFKNLEQELSQFNIKSINISLKTSENVKELHDLIFKSAENIDKLASAGNMQYLEMDDESKLYKYIYIYIYYSFCYLAFTKTLNELKYQSKKNLKILVSLFLLGISIIYYIIHSLPELTPFQKQAILQFPRTPAALKLFVNGVSVYTESHYYHVVVLFIWCYLL